MLSDGRLPPATARGITVHDESAALTAEPLLPKNLEVAGANVRRLASADPSLLVQCLKEARMPLLDRRTHARILALLAVITLGVITAAASASQTAANAAPVSPKMLQQCFNESGGYLHDNLMVGTPCPPFMNRRRVLAYVRNLLVNNGFRRAMTVTKYWARQIKLDGIQDGVEYAILVVKSGPRQIAIERSGYSGLGGVYVDRLNVSFVP